MATDADRRRELADAMRGGRGIAGVPLGGLFAVTVYGMYLAAPTEASLRGGLWMLADAIDPTCHMAVDGSVWSEELGELTDYACDRCGKVAYGQQERPGFCPICGARVVPGDG